ncbi:MAG: thermonuclease family protein [Moraxellaceae bacterium]|nr:thermonuclease family protein [Moraxellaceae bacterium]MDP1775222.1 thermonuclease family protein [Moraxellaceae bacterium]MDZ4298404.1 thermonuclease family protein [Moraxellaceae bacterium]MDZ4387999.1 thermonuclease family protein [Moraxellaceae bacterium]
MKCLLTLLLITMINAAQAQELSSEPLVGLVVHVGDGDSITLLDAQQQRHRIRLGEIDAPELGQAYGQAAKRTLRQIIAQQHVRIHLLDIDQYGRIVGIVYLNDQDVNAYMLEQGMAWIYHRYLRRPELKKIEQEAREQKRGLWQQPEHLRVAPWTWRQQHRKRQQSPKLKDTQ